jgi:2-polyprenyl-3-methyl-5-hydroxy-6-metoxy-1,4-benzoquinol methylase
MPSNQALKHGSPESTVVEANVEFYRQIASKYDRYETCASNPRLQQALDRDLDRIEMLLGQRSRPIQCLDCGGGTGNFTLRMLKKGWSVTVVDVSPDMLDILANKARRSGYSPRLVRDSISNFLAGSQKTYDVVAFCSVLHHLYEYLPIVAQAAERIGQNGVFYSTFDPVIARFPRGSHWFESFDTVLAKFMHDRGDFFPGMARRAKKFFQRRAAPNERPVAGPGDLAEYHAKSGLDDAAIVQSLEDRGFTVIDRSRWAAGRTAPARAVNRRLRLMENFKIIAQRGP